MAIVGLGGAVSTTAIAGLHLLRVGAIGTDGLPPAVLRAGFFSTWRDTGMSFLAGGISALTTWLRQPLPQRPRRSSVRRGVTGTERLHALAPVGNRAFLANVDGQIRAMADNHRELRCRRCWIGAALIGSKSFAREVVEHNGTRVGRFTFIPGAVATERFTPREDWEAGVLIDPQRPRLL